VVGWEGSYVTTTAPLHFLFLFLCFWDSTLWILFSRNVFCFIIHFGKISENLLFTSIEKQNCSN
jgi:hypothetical protein